MYYQALSKAIADGFPSLSPQLQVAEHHALDRPGDVALISVGGLAANAGVHPTTMVRLSPVLLQLKRITRRIYAVQPLTPSWHQRA